MVIRGDQDRRPALDGFTSNADSNEVRLALALARRLGPSGIHSVCCFDADAAYLQTPIQSSTPVYVRPPPELRTTPTTLWRLKKAVYGLVDSGRLFEEKMRKALIACGGTPIPGLKHTWILPDNLICCV